MYEMEQIDERVILVGIDREMKMRQTVRLTNFRNWRKLQKRL